MREFHHDEVCKQKDEREDNWHIDTTWLTPEDFLREEELSNPEGAKDDVITLLKAKFDYIQDIMSYASMPGVRRMIERFLKTGPKKF